MPALPPLSDSLSAQGRALVERLGGRWTGAGGMCRCPAHDDRTPSLSVRVGRTSLLLHCFAGCDTARVLEALREGGFRLRSGQGHPAPAAREFGASGAARRLWEEARPIAGTLAERYLAARAIEAPYSEELRYHPRTPQGRRPFTRFRPALIAAIRDNGGLVAVHRSFLEPDGSGLAAIEAPRMGLGRFGAGAVRLGGVAPRLGLAEGIETALSAARLFGLPVWATLGTERFARVEVPAQVREIVLFPDNDAGGRRAERLARAVFADRVARACYPPGSGADWNALSMHRSAAAHAV